MSNDMNMLKNQKNVRETALAFIILMGIVSMFSDMTHEGAASILGDYLSLAGASAAAIGFVTGLGGFIGYSLRLFTGYLADRTKSYWTITILGYVIDCLAIPALALIPRTGWIWACLLIVIQKTGKAVKKPAKDSILSFAATRYGAGKSFAIQEFLDQLGAFLGPLLLFLVLYFRSDTDTFLSYKYCFAFLGIPAIVTILILLFAKQRFPNPEEFEPEKKASGEKLGTNKAYFLFIAAIFLFGFGFLGFPLITMHAAKHSIVSTSSLPLIYAGAMAVDAFAALIFGYLFDKIGLRTLAISSVLSAPFASFIFGTNNLWIFFIGIVLWGVGMGAQESILKAAVAVLVPKSRRSSGYGIFQTCFGIAFFLGSCLTGYLYDVSMTWMIWISILSQLIAVPIFMMSDAMFRKKNGR